MTDPIQTVLGVKSSVLVAGFVGAAVSSVFSNGPWWQSLIQAFVGAAVSIYLTPFVVDTLDGWTHVHGEELERGAAFICGLVGMAFVGGVIGYARRIAKRPAAFLEGLRRRG